MAQKHVEVVIYHGREAHMRSSTENDILPENVPDVARLLMDGLYLRLDDQVSAAKLRAHRRDLRRKKRDGNKGGQGDGTSV